VSDGAQAIHVIGSLRIFVEGPYVFVEDQEIPMTATEMRLINYLVAHRGEVCAPAELLRDVWAIEHIPKTKKVRAAMYKRVRVAIKSLRDKLGATGSVIETVWGTGYRIPR
jgi:DNA-binding response OmpR family regulator